MALTSYLLQISWTGKWNWIKTPLDWPLLCLLALCLLSSVFSVHPYTSIWSLILLLNYLTIFYLTLHLIRTRSQLRHFIYLIIGIATFLSVFGLFKRFGSNPFPWWNYTDISQSIFRLSSTFGNPDHLAGYMEMALPLTLGLLLWGYRGGKLILMIYLSCLTLTALVLSLSRGAWFGAMVSLAFMSIALLSDRQFQSKRLLLTLIGGFFVVAFVVLASTPVVERIRTFEQGERMPSLADRVKVWAKVVDLIDDYPVVGTGPGTFAVAYTRYQPPGLVSRFTMAHNDYLHFVSEAGLKLAVIMVWMMVALYRKGFQKLKNPSRFVRGTTLGALSGITAILIHSIGDFNLHIPANAILFTVLAAIVAAPIPEQDRQKNKWRSSKPTWQELLLDNGSNNTF